LTVHDTKVTVVIKAIGVVIPFSPLGRYLGFTTLPRSTGRFPAQRGVRVLRKYAYHEGPQE